MVRRAEPLWWFLFAAGGSAAALLVPVLILLTGFAAPAGGAAGVFAYERVAPVVFHPLTRLVLFGLAALSFFHWAHRFRYTMAEGLALKRAWLPVAVTCYGLAVVGTAIAAVIVLAP